MRCAKLPPARHPAGAEHRDTRLLRQTVQYVDRHYAEKNYGGGHHAQCGYSSSHFMKRFHDLTGTSFAQYLIHFRLERPLPCCGAAGTPCWRRRTVRVQQCIYFTRAFTGSMGVSPPLIGRAAIEQTISQSFLP